MCKNIYFLKYKINVNTALFVGLELKKCFATNFIEK